MYTLVDMGKELRLEKRARKRNIQRIILQTIATAGVVSVGLIVPNVLSAMNTLGLVPYKRQGESIKNARKKLIQNRLICFVGGRVQITEKGRRFLFANGQYTHLINRKKRWDKKWRVLIFDIPEKKRNLRNQIRKSLVSVGFMRLQDSVWIYPYDCEEYITLLKAEFKIGKDVLYMIVEELEYDKPIRLHFGFEK